MKHILTLCLLAASLESYSQKIKIKYLNRERQKCWNEYRATLAAQPQFLTSQLPMLEEGKSNSALIPADLETDAEGNAVTLNYYYGCKGVHPGETGKSAAFLYMHGSGPRDMEWATGLNICRMFDDAPSVYFIPQIPQEGKWYRWYQKSKQWMCERLLREWLARPDIDPARIYFFGISEGGYGSQRLASFYADYLAGAGPMAGGEPLKNAPVENLRHIAFTLRTGAEDYGFYRDRMTACTAAAIDSMQRLFPSDFTHWVELIPGRGHSIDYRPTPQYLSRHQRKPLPAAFTWEDMDMDGRHRNGFYYLAVDKRPCDSLRTRYDVEIQRTACGGALISVDVRDVIYTCTEKDPRWDIELRFDREYRKATGGRFTLMLDEYLVDLDKEVTLVVNGEKKFSGKLRLDRKNMQRSIELWGDPLRILPAAVTVNY